MSCLNHIAELKKHLRRVHADCVNHSITNTEIAHPPPVSVTVVLTVLIELHEHSVFNDGLFLLFRNIVYLNISSYLRAVLFLLYLLSFVTHTDSLLGST